MRYSKLRINQDQNVSTDGWDFTHIASVTEATEKEKEEKKLNGNEVKRRSAGKSAIPATYSVTLESKASWRRSA
jgi:hypothetical protein